jgi:predicted lipoprotein with Yx(FWY)xxD motif
MKQLLPMLGAMAVAAIVVTAAQAHRNAATVVALGKTALGSVLVDSRGRTLYLFEKDRNGVSSCNGSCAAYWPPLTSHGTPRAGKGLHQSLLGLGGARNGVRQVTYGGHPLYRFVGDRRAGETTGEGLRNFGATWYVLAATDRKVEGSENGSTGGAGW